MGCGFGGVVGCGFGGVVACASSKLSSNAITIGELYEVRTDRGERRIIAKAARGISE